MPNDKVIVASTICPEIHDSIVSVEIGCEPFETMCDVARHYLAHHSNIHPDDVAEQEDLIDSIYSSGCDGNGYPSTFTINNEWIIKRG